MQGKMCSYGDGVIPISVQSPRPRSRSTPTDTIAPESVADSQARYIVDMQGPWIVVMGVSGSGKSSVGAALASALGLPFVEGDDFHSARNVQRMRDGHALSDADRSDWLAALAEQLRLHPRGAVMSCSALRQCYRQTLREAVPALSFLFLDLPQSEAERRVIAREHFFSPALVQSQFETLESPDEESGVLRVSAIQPIEAIVHTQLQALGR